MTQGGPIGATNTLVIELYRQGFVYRDLGAGAAVGMIGLSIALVVTLIYFRLTPAGLKAAKGLKLMRSHVDITFCASRAVLASCAVRGLSVLLDVRHFADALRASCSPRRPQILADPGARSPSIAEAFHDDPGHHVAR